MINYENIEVTNLYTEGFVTSLENTELKVSAGTFHHIEKDETFVTDYAEFSFEVVADTQFDVVYDVYLLETNGGEGSNIHIDRTEIGSDTIAFYQGTTPLLHCLISFVVPPNTIDFSAIDIKVRTLKLRAGEIG